MEILKANGLEIWASYILGAHEEGRRDIMSTIRYSMKLDTNTAQFTLLTPFPGTDLYEDLKDRIIEKDWNKYDGVHSVYKHPVIRRFELQLWLFMAYILFYFRHSGSIINFFRFLLNKIRGLKTADKS